MILTVQHRYGKPVYALQDEINPRELKLPQEIQPKAVMTVPDECSLDLAIAWARKVGKLDASQ